jgi:hypothetical protein
VEFLQPAGLLIPVAHHAPLSQHTNCILRISVGSAIAQEIKGRNFITATQTVPAVNRNGHVCFEKTQNVMGSL